MIESIIRNENLNYRDDHILGRKKNEQAQQVDETVNKSFVILKQFWVQFPVRSLTSTISKTSLGIIQLFGYSISDKIYISARIVQEILPVWNGATGTQCYDHIFRIRCAKMIFSLPAGIAKSPKCR